MDHYKTQYMKSEGNWPCHRLECAHFVLSNDGCKMKNWNRAGFFPPPQPPALLIYRQDDHYSPSRYHSWGASRPYRNLQNEQLLASPWEEEKKAKALIDFKL